MQEQKKNLNFSKNSNITQLLQTVSKLLTVKRKRKAKKKLPGRLLFSAYRIQKFLVSSPDAHRTILYLHLKQNNIFATLLKARENKIWKTQSCGLYKIKITKRRLKAGCVAFLKRIFAFLRRFLKNKKLILSIIAPRHLRRFIIQKFFNQLDGFSLFIHFQQKKCFNGCRVKKCRRKKHKRYRILQ